MALQRITLHLARTKEHPNGSAAHGYEFVAPLDSSGHLDSEGWKENRNACRVRRFWGAEEYDLGHLVHRGGAVKGGSWAFTYDIAGDEDDEAGYRFGAHSFNPGDYVSIKDDDDEMHTFVVAMVMPA
ncbi:MAG TPA: hypothetical protein PKW21_06620 [Rhabdaerophilum sp.]|nr:hypothetical protein [Rhabdaerophilum sp.]